MTLQLSRKQLEVQSLIEQVSIAIGDNPLLPLAIAMAESSLGINQKSPTGAKGVFNLTSIAMKDLLQEMEKSDDEVLDTLCGIAFIHLLLRRHKELDKVIAHYCNPADRDFYVPRVRNLMREFIHD